MKQLITNALVTSFFKTVGLFTNSPSALSSSRRNDLIMQQWCGMNAEKSLTWTSHRGPTLQLSMQAWLEISRATVTAPTTTPQTPRRPWLIRSLSTPLAYCCRGSPPVLSAHHERVHTERLSTFALSNTRLFKYAI